MANKYSVLALIGVTQAATPGPMPALATFPKFATTAPPTGATNIDGAFNVLSGFSKSGTSLAGPYNAFRNDLVVFPT